MKVVVLFSVLVATTLGAVLKDGTIVPTYSTVCRRSDSNFNECFKKSISEVMQKISKDGIKEIGLKSLDPLYVPEILGSLDTQTYHFKSLVKEAYNYGLGKIQILNIRSSFKDPEDINIEVDFFLPKFVTKGIYKVDGNMAEFQISGKGPFNVSMSDITGTMKINGHLVTVDNVQHLRIHRISLRPDVGDMKVYFENLISGNPELSQIALTFINQFWRIIYSEMLPYAEETFDKVLRNTMNQVTLKIPYNQLIPE